MSRLGTPAVISEGGGGGGGGGITIANDPIWDAAGDIVQGTGPDAAARLAIGSAFQILRVNSIADALEYIGGLTLISDTVLGSAAASIDIQNIPQTFKHLVGIFNGAGTKAATTATLIIRFNNDSGNNYHYTYEQITSSASHGRSVSTTNCSVGLISGATATAGDCGGGIIYIPDYANSTFRKVGTSRSTAGMGDGTGIIIAHNGGFKWDSTSTINRITLVPDSNNLDTGFRFTLYGIS